MIIHQFKIDTWLWLICRWKMWHT